MEDLTPEQIAQHYSAAMDSVALLNAGQPEGMDDADWQIRYLATYSILKLWLQRTSGLMKT